MPILHNDRFGLTSTNPSGAKKCARYDGCIAFARRAALFTQAPRGRRRRSGHNQHIPLYRRPGAHMQTSTKPPETRRLYQHVADQIRAFIKEGGIAPGTRLPPEREFAMQLGVSRPSLREALIALEIDGRVEIRMGSGVYVCQPAATAERATPALGESPSELMHARAALEG